MQTIRRISPIRPFADSPLRRKDRGTVIVLVVAVLALLAVIGTIYVVAARAERATSSSMNATYNLKLARDAIMQQTIEVIGNSTMSPNGVVGAYSNGGAGVLNSHNYDYRDGTEIWLSNTLHNHGDWTDTSSMLTSAGFDPSAGTYTLALSNTFNVVNDQTAPALDPYTTAASPNVPLYPDAVSGLVADSYINLLPFSDASGIRYRFGVRILDTSRMANLNIGSVDDVASQSDTFGTWLDSMRLAPISGTLPTTNAYFNTVDTPNAANLQVSPSSGFLGRSSANSTMGNAAFSLANWQQQVLRFEKPTDIFLTPFDLADELELRSYGEFGTSYHIRFAVADSATFFVWPNTLSASPANPASLAVGGNPTGAVPTGNRSRKSYTTYSWSRDLRPYGDPLTTNIYNLTIASGDALPSGTPSTIWPKLPAPISVNPLTSVTSSPADAIYYTAMAATNFATLMEFNCAVKNSDGTANSNFIGGPNSYTHEEACAFAANYCTAKWNGFIPDPAITTVQAYYLPGGPSFVDDTGICIRTATSNTTASAVPRNFGPAVGTNPNHDLHAETPHKIYLGYSAQPFFSEVAATMIIDDSAGAPGTVVVSNSAVELFNPYSVALSLNGYHLKSGDGSTDIDLTPAQYIPANGYLVVTSGHFSGPGTATVFTAATLKVNPSGDTKFILYRPYTNRSLAQCLAPVDDIDYASLTTNPGVGDTLPVLSTPGAIPIDFSAGRSGGPWGPTIGSALSARSKSAITMGTMNAATLSGFPLPDRYAPMAGASAPYSAAPTQGAVFGLGEFARIMRIAHEFDGTNATGALIPYGGTNGGLIPDHIAQLPSTGAVAPYSTMVMTNTTTTDPIDSQILFDYYADPSFFSQVGPPIDVSGKHDIRAVRLMEQITLMDRYSEFGIDIGGGAADINKIRLPGRININTASGDVLRAIPNMTDQMVANIIGYRVRGIGTYNGAVSPNFSNVTTYPGIGIRTLGELLVPLSNPLATAAAAAPTPASTIDVRDQFWGPICNLCTVRSDTFVVYGYLEAVKVNPYYTISTHDNASNWYGLVTDTPVATAPNIPNVRVVRRRFVAIVDRSFCNQNKFQADGVTLNPKYTLPKIVAIKDLPQ